MSEMFPMHDSNSNGVFVGQEVAAELLDEVKAAFHERSRTEGKLIHLGSLKTPENAHLWNTEGISVQRRVDAGEVELPEIAEARTALDQYYMPTSEGARKRCIDGSTGAGFDDRDPILFGAPLGPQIQGGTFGEAVARRVALGMPADEPELTIVDDIAELHKKRASKYKEGVHDDDHAGNHEAKTGCGQFDGQTRKQPRYADEASATQYFGTADTVLTTFAGIMPPAGVRGQICSSATSLAARPGYFATPAAALAAVESINPAGKETVIRPHNEFELVINLVPGTTFHRDHFNSRTNSKLQAFNLDAWVFYEEHDEAAAYALVVDAVATYFDLTDGSGSVSIRVPRPADEPLPETA